MTTLRISSHAISRYRHRVDHCSTMRAAIKMSERLVGNLDCSVMGRTSEWMVLRCPSSKTLQLVKRLEYFDAWSPLWNRRRRKPRSHKVIQMEVPAIPSFVFIPEGMAAYLPKVASIPYSLMHINGIYVRIHDRELNHLRKIDSAPKVKPRIEYKPGQMMKFHAGPFSGLSIKVIYHSASYVQCMVEGFSQPLKIAPSIIQETAA